MKIFETHAHYDDERFDEDRDELISSMLSDTGELDYIVNVGASRQGCEASLALAAQYEKVYAAIGFHPEDIVRLKESDIEWLENMLGESKTRKIVALGEIGLDYYWDKSFKELQKEVFIKQIKFANQMNLPINIHCRDAYFDTLEILKKHNRNSKAILHCFSGSLEFAKECIKNGIYIALGGVVTFKNAKKTKEVAQNIPLEFMLLETDDPYLAPVPYRGKENQPLYVKYVAEEIAKLRNISTETVYKITTQNAFKIFNFT